MTNPVFVYSNIPPVAGVWGQPGFFPGPGFVFTQQDIISALVAGGYADPDVPGAAGKPITPDMFATMTAIAQLQATLSPMLPPDGAPDLAVVFQAQQTKLRQLQVYPFGMAPQKAPL